MNTGIQLASAMWALTTLSLVLVGLRLYTRMRIIKFVGAEDHMYFWTGIFLLVFTCSIQVGVHYGLGRNFWALPFADSSNAIFWTYVANSFAITGNAMAKLSMGLFLLRVVQIRWHKVTLWVLVAITVATSVALTIMLWNQTTPVKASWDPLRTPGKWNISIQPLSVGLGAWSSAVDFFFAIFPWMFIWSLRMPQREKIMLASGMSLGVIAGVCGIVRTVVLSRLDVYNYTLNFVPYFGWAGAEIAVAMICIGIPTLRPLYLKKRHGVTTMYGNRATNPSNDHLPRFTMLDQKGGAAAASSAGAGSPSDTAQHAASPTLAGSSLRSPLTLREKPLDLESATTARDSGCSHAFSGSSSVGGGSSFHAGTPPNEEVSPVLATPLRPPSAHTRKAGSLGSGGLREGRWRDDSVDEILGLYDSPNAGVRRGHHPQQQQQQQHHHHQQRRPATAGGMPQEHLRRPATAGSRPGDRGGNVWARNDFQVRRDEEGNWPLRG